MYDIYHLYDPDSFQKGTSWVVDQNEVILFSWNSARDFCRNQNGTLLTITDGIEFENVLNMVKATLKFIVSIYIGLYGKVC